MKLFGPVLPYDMLRMGRRSRYLIMRCLYILILLVVLWLVYQSYALAMHLVGKNLTQIDLANFGETFFGYFLTAQYAVILLITPAYVASAIAEEKQRKTLEFMLATDLRNREIVLGKLMARLANIFLFLLAGLPVISLAQLFGGIPPILLWCGFGATVMTVLSLTSVSILMSVYARRVRDALLYSYLVLIGYFVFWGFLELVKGFLELSPPAPWYVIEFMNLVLEAYKAGNPFVGLYNLVEHVQTTGSLGTRPIELLIVYSIFHGVVALLCTMLAIFQVRRVYVRQAFGGAARRRKPVEASIPQPAAAQKKAPPRKIQKHPPVGADPMLWKELHVERGMRLGVLGQSVLAIFFLICLSPGLVLGGVHLLNVLQRTSMTYEQTAESMNAYLRIMGTFLFVLILIGIGVRAASCIAAEKDRQTMDGLLSSPLTLNSILFAKWLGSILGMRWLYGVLGIVLLLGIVTQGIHFLAIPGILAAIVVYSAFAASVGLFFAATARSGLRAVMGTIVLLMVLCVVPCLFTTERFTPARDMLPGAALRSVSPLFVFEFANFWDKDIREASFSSRASVDRYYWRSSYSTSYRRPEEPNALTGVNCLCAVLGLMLYGGFTLLLSWGAAERFRQTCGRITLQRRPEPRVMLGPARAAKSA